MRRQVALAVALPAAALAAVAAVVLVNGGSPSGGAPEPAAHRAGTELVARRTLVDRAQLDGTLGYGSERPAMDRLGGTLTWLPRAGAVIRPGRRLFAVDGEPVILMDGAVPAWRALSVGVADGVDVRQLERGLAALGYDPGTVDESFTVATAAAVRRWQAALRLSETGSVELGRVAFLPGPRRIAQVDATLGSAGGSGGSSPAAWDGAAPRYAYADYEAGGTVPATPTPTTPRTTPTAPAPSGGQPGGSDDDGSNGDGGSGGAVAAATKVLTTTSTVRVVTADLDAADQQLARVGTAALVVLPDGRRVRGRVIRVGTVVSDSDNADGGGAGGAGGGDPTLPLTIRLRSLRAVGTLDEAPVAVQLTRISRRNVLAVPIEALIARSGGGYAVRVVRGARIVTVPIQPGLFADGYVEVAGGAVHEGDRVQVPK